MTTIVWDGRTLAADGRSTAGERIASNHTDKIHTPPLGTSWHISGQSVLAIGVAGDAGASRLIRTLMQMGSADPECTNPGLDMDFEDPTLAPYIFHAIAVLDNGDTVNLIKEEDKTSIHHTLVGSGTLHYGDAVGSGADFAIAALACGKDALGAVEIACQLDCFSGGVITTWSMPSYEYDGDIPF